MATYRIHSTKDYTVMSNTHLRDKNMSLKAKGLLSLMLSLPDSWDYSVEGLVSLCKENISSIENALKELKSLGYLIVTKKMPNETESGRIEYQYDIYESPKQKQKQEGEKQGVENLWVEIQGVENPQQSNTNKLNTYKSITYNKEKERKKEAEKQTTYDEILSVVEDEELREMYKEYIKMRKLNKSAMTDRALQMLIAKVNRLEPNSIERKKILLENAIMGNWKSVYPIKDDDKSNNNRQGDNIFLQIAEEEGIKW